MCYWVWWMPRYDITSNNTESRESTFSVGSDGNVTNNSNECNYDINVTM